MSETLRRIVLVHGPNLNRLGQRDPQHYGTIRYDELISRVESWAREQGMLLRHFQSNHEGALIDWLQEQSSWAEGGLINAGALTHSSFALHDALLDFARPMVEVHLSKISEREPWRRVSVLAPACMAQIEGLGVEGYRVALARLAAALQT